MNTANFILVEQLRKWGWIHHLARHCVACFLTRGDLVIAFTSLFVSRYVAYILIDTFGYFGSLYIGKKDEMFSIDFLLTQTGQSIMLTGCGYLVHHSFTRSGKHGLTYGATILESLSEILIIFLACFFPV